MGGRVRRPPNLSTLDREPFLKYGLITQRKSKEQSVEDVFGNHRNMKRTLRGDRVGFLYVVTFFSAVALYIFLSITDSRIIATRLGKTQLTHRSIWKVSPNGEKYEWEPDATEFNIRGVGEMGGLKTRLRVQ